MKKTLLLVLLMMGIFSSAQNITLTNYCSDTTFDLTQASSQIIANENPAQFNITYHLSQADATNNLNPIANPSNYQSTSSPQLIFARVENSVALTTTIVPVNLVVNGGLQVFLNSITMPPSSLVVASVSGGQQPYTYLWSMNGAATVSGGATFQLPVNAPGIYAVMCTVTDATGCTSTSTISVVNLPTLLIQANDDNFTFTNSDGLITPPGVGNALQNDTVGGTPATINNVVVSTLWTTNSNIGINAQGYVYANSQTPSGTYSLSYQICEINNPSNCATATVTVTVDYCRTPTPTIDSVTQPSCQVNSGAIALSGLPDMGTWTIHCTKQPNGPTQTITGTGTTTTIANLAPGNYQLNVLAEDILLTNCFESFDLGFELSGNLYGIQVSMAATYEDYNNDGYTNVGDVVHYTFAVTNNDCNDITNVTLSNQQLNIVGGPIAVLSSGNTDTTTFSATYAITQNDINTGMVLNTVVVLGTLNGNQIINDAMSELSLNLSDGIKLNAFIDTNTNGVQDPGEINFSQGEFTYTINGGADNNIASSNGTHFIYESNPTNVYHLAYAVHPALAANYSVSPNSYSNVTVANGSGITTYNFPLTVLPFNDLAVYLYTYSAPPRPGFIYQNYLTYTNQGNQTVSGTVTFTKDAALSIVSTSASGAVMNTNGFTFDFTNLQPHETRNITVTMQVPTIPTVALGQQLTNTCSISLLPNDIAPNNNNSSLTQTIIGSYDPNDKAESHGSEIVFSDFSANDYLTYTIRFENTGTASAINVKVDDVLDAQLDETSVRTIATSHPYVLKRLGSALSWQFDGIDLPPSVEGDPTTGHGYVVFQVKPKTGYALGDVIPNSANIYFDFNPAIVTNTCTTEFVPFLSNATFAFNELKYAPNPVRNQLIISNDLPIEKVSVTTTLGQVVFTQNTQSTQAQIDLSALAPGVYFVKAEAQKQIKTFKIIKE
ncbi:MAG: T9SS type A sorting domain-containing protein [Flavobacteriaceae bacterium]